MDHYWFSFIITNRMTRKFFLALASFPVFQLPFLDILYSPAIQRDRRNSEKANTTKGESGHLWYFCCNDTFHSGAGDHCEGHGRLGGEGVPWCLQSAQLRVSTRRHEFLNTKPSYLLVLFFSCSLLALFQHIPNVFQCKPALLKGCKTPSCCKVRFFRTHLHLFSVAALITHNKGI